MRALLHTAARRAGLFAATVIAVLTSAQTSRALEFTCIEGAKYRNLMRIFGEDPEALQTYFRLPRSARPAPDVCRAVVVTGTLADGDAKKLLGEILKSNGWLATLYLYHSGSNPTEEVRIASLIRTFWMKTSHIGRTPAYYEPEFVIRGASAAPSSTGAWPLTQSSKQPLHAGREDYMRTVERKLPDLPGKPECTEGCVSIFLAGMDRQALAPATESLKPLDVPPGNESRRLSAALRLWLEGTSFDVKAASLPASAVMNAVRRYPRVAVAALRADCAVEIDANIGAQEQVKTTIEGLAKRSFDRFVRVENVLPRFDAVHTTMGRLQACVAGSFERKRQAALGQYCQQKCDLDTIDATLTQRAQELVKSWTP